MPTDPSHSVPALLGPLACGHGCLVRHRLTLHHPPCQTLRSRPFPEPAAWAVVGCQWPASLRCSPGGAGTGLRSGRRRGASKGPPVGTPRPGPPIPPGRPVSAAQSRPGPGRCARASGSLSPELAPRLAPPHSRPPASSGLQSLVPGLPGSSQCGDSVGALRPCSPRSCPKATRPRQVAEPTPQTHRRSARGQGDGASAGRRPTFRLAWEPCWLRLPPKRPPPPGVTSVRWRSCPSREDEQGRPGSPPSRRPRHPRLRAPPPAQGPPPQGRLMAHGAARAPAITHWFRKQDRRRTVGARPETPGLSVAEDSWPSLLSASGVQHSAQTFA